MPSSTDSKSTFMIEMSEHLRHIIMRRNYLLRSAKSKKLQCREQIAGKSWLEVDFVAKKTDVVAWDQAHYLAEKFRAELKADVFVEPAYEAGRYHQQTAPLDWGKSHFGSGEQRDSYLDNSIALDPMAAIGLSQGGRQNRHAGSHFSVFGRGSGISGFSGSFAGMPSVPSMPNVGGMQSPTDFLPAHVREALSYGQKSSEIVLPSLRELEAFGELPETTQKMFEVEAVQLLQGLTAGVEASEHNEQSLSALSKLPKVSKRLKQFLAKALPVAA
jgi:hypothetical protein